MAEENNDKTIADSDESRRSFMKKSALASGALAVGVSGSGTVAGDSTSLQASSVLVFAYDFHPQLSFETVARLDNNVTRQVLGETNADEGDYDGYLVRYPDQGEYSLAFIPENQTLEGSNSFNMDVNPVWEDPQANLLEVGLNG